MTIDPFYSRIAQTTYTRWIRAMMLGNPNDTVVSNVVMITYLVCPHIPFRLWERRCPVCNKKFMYGFHLLTHLTKATIDCANTLRSFYGLLWLLKKDAEEYLSYLNGPWKCRICGQKIKGHRYALLHVLTNHPNKLRDRLFMVRQACRKLCEPYCYDDEMEMEEKSFGKTVIKHVKP